MQRQFQFYIVPTPIGNLSDMTFRAVEILKSVDMIYCEDTRVTQKILHRYDIHTKLTSYHKYNEKQNLDKILMFLQSGKTAALVSDAGTPMICDPGSVLIKLLRKNNISITALSGACAISTFLSQIPRESEIYTFVGFFPKTSGKAKELLLQFSNSDMVFYESPNRITDTLKFIREIRGNTEIALGRELTKLYEEVIIGEIDNVLDFLGDEIRGEIICMIYKKEEPSKIDIDAKILLLKDSGYKSKDISLILSTLYGLNKNEIYKRII